MRRPIAPPDQHAREGSVNPRQFSRETLTDGAQIQLSLPPNWDARWDHDRALLRRCVDDMTLKEASYRLDVGGSQLLHSLDGRDYHYFRASWVAPLIAGAASNAADEYVADLAALRGLDLVPANPPDPAEELAALKEVLAEQLGGDVRNAILARAKARTRKTR